jgi:hypothetical protein
MNLKFAAAAVVAGVSLVAVGVWYGAARAAVAEPGSVDDPLVTKSYVEQLVAGLADKAYVDQAVAGRADKAYVDQALKGLVDKSYLETRLSLMNASYQVVTLAKGQRMIGESGTEMVLRAGKATAIVSAKGGVLDATGGVDLGQGETVKPNHLLVIPVADGRGLNATTDVILIVKGNYSVRLAGQ